jgi:hypothetical protein
LCRSLTDYQLSACACERRRFEIERDEPLIEGEMLQQFTMVYEVMRVLPGEGGFDAVAEVELRSGPGQVLHTAS